MNRVIYIFILITTFCLVKLNSHGQEDWYVKIYEMIQTGDSLLSSGNLQGAYEKYIQAQSEILNLQKMYPNWNQNVINYRLEYLSGKISELKAKNVTLPVKPVEAPQPVTSEKPVAKSMSQEELNAQIQNLQQQIAALKTEKQQLEVRLKEALSVRPVAVDPGELSRAEEKIRNLEKQVSLMKVSLEQEKERNSKLIEPSTFAAIQKVLAETTEKLDQQIKENKLLLSQKESLEKMLNEEKARASSKAEQKEIKQLQNKIEELNKQIEKQEKIISTLEKDKIDLQKKLKMKYPTMTPDSLLAAENENLKRQLEELQRRVAAESADALKSELAKVKEEFAALKGQYEALKLEKTLLENRLKSSSQDPMSAEANARMKELEAKLLTTTSQIAQKDSLIQNLQAENEKLQTSLKEIQKQLTDKSKSGDSDKIKSLQNELARATANAQEVTKKLAEVQSEKEKLEKQLAMIASERKSTAESKSLEAKKIRELEKENEELLKRLNALNKDYYKLKNKAQVSKIESLEAQINSLRSRLDAYEQKKIPFTDEELALMKRTEVSKVNAEKYQPRPMRELPEQATKLVIEAQSDIESGKYGQAEAKLREALKFDSAHLSTLFRLASVQIEQNKLDEAEKTINQALSIDPEDAGALFLLGILNDRKGNVDAAIEAFSRSAKSNPANADTQIYLGIALSKKGLREQAETAFRKALQINPGNPLAHMNLSVIYASQNPPYIELAKWHYQKALSNGASRNPELEKKLNISTENKSQ